MRSALRRIIIAGGGPASCVGPRRPVPVTREAWHLQETEGRSRFSDFQCWVVYLRHVTCAGWRPSLTSAHITCELSLAPVCDVEGCDACRHSRQRLL